ncbi:MAG: hypothetical protein K2X87_22850, partial [Gemmataceae bacterium]|nr:hypothetical protein [Gemmataceae bacterium]
MTRPAVSLAVALAAVVTAAPARAGVLPPDTPIAGESQLTRAERWQQRAVRFGPSTSPLLDGTGAQAFRGDQGPAFFLAGTTGGSATRTVTVPAGAVLFFPLLNGYWDNTTPPGDPPTTFTPAEMLGFLDSFLNPGAVTLLASVDGVDVPDLTDHRQTTDPDAPFGYTVTDPDNWITFFGFDPTLGTGVYPATVFPVVQDGYYLAVMPFAPGTTHTLHFGGTIPPFGFEVDVTYFITVAPAAVPEPASALLGLGGLGLAALR